MAKRDYRAIADALLGDLNRHDLKAYVRHYSADATHWDPTEPGLTRAENFEESLGAYLRAFPDLHCELTNVIGDDEYFAYEWVGRGTHTGPLASPQGEIPPTGRRIEVRACSVIRLNAQGLIAEEREYWDMAGFMQQLGLMP